MLVTAASSVAVSAAQLPVANRAATNRAAGTPFAGQPYAGSPVVWPPVGAAPAYRSPVSEPGWAPQVVMRGEDRERLQATPILERPYRPLHFYGNTVRRMHYRGTPLPTPRETAAMPLRMAQPR